LEHFPIEQFLILRLEDYNKDPKEYMSKVFGFLSVTEPSSSDWVKILHNKKENVNPRQYNCIFPETEQLLREFYKPYNDLLAKLLDNDGYRWATSYLSTYQRAVARADPREEELRAERARDRYERRSPIRSISHPEDQHGANPRLHIDPPEHTEESEPKANLRKEPSVSGVIEASGLTVLNPRGFNTTGLPWHYSDVDPPFNEWMSTFIDKGPLDIAYNAQAALQLCAASFALDLAAVKYLLFDVGISAALHLQEDGQRTPLHCLSIVEILADANAKSYIFALLKNKPNWLTPVLDPPMPTMSHVPMASDIVASMERPAVRIAHWLLAAGADVNAVDITFNTALHMASYGGFLGLVELFLARGANPNMSNREQRTPLHNAVALGHVKVAALLIGAGADLDAKDVFGVTPREIIENPGPILQREASEYFNMTQRDVRSIGRVANPELVPADNEHGWQHGTGGWGPERLDWVGDDMACDIDQFWAHEISGDEIFDKYLARSAPVLIRGLIDDCEWMHM
jgi:hypothetical protein